MSILKFKRRDEGHIEVKHAWPHLWMDLIQIRCETIVGNQAVPLLSPYSYFLLDKQASNKKSKLGLFN